MMNMFAAGPNDSYMASNAAQPNLLIDFKELTTIVLSVAGPIFFMCMQVSSLQTARMIFVTKHVGNLSSFPFLSLVTNGTVWFIYGSVKTDWTILIPNFSAVVVGGICTTVFQINSKDDIPRSFYAFAMIVILPALVFGFRGDSISLGLMGVFVSILLMGSPLSTVTTVLKERKTDSMPFETSFAAFLNSLSWSLYGYLIVDDLMLWLPAVIGLLLATFQLTLFIFFGFPSPSPRQDSLPQTFVSIQGNERIGDIAMRRLHVQQSNVYTNLQGDQKNKSYTEDVKVMWPVISDPRNRLEVESNTIRDAD